MSETIDAEWLRSLGEDGLGRLLRRRPEVLTPPVPGSLAELADRLTAQGSVYDALQRVNRPALQVAEALTALGGRADRPTLDRLLGATAAGPVDAALATLRDYALLLPGPALALVPAVRSAWPNPLNLGAPVEVLLSRRTADDLRATARRLRLKVPQRKAEVVTAMTAALRDQDRVREVVAAAPGAVRELLREVAITGEHPHDYSYYSGRYAEPRSPEQWAAAHGLLVRQEWEGCLLMPAEVALALRGPDYTAPFDPEPPSVGRTTTVDPEVVARDAAAAGAAMVRLVAALLDEAGRAPVTTLRSGGVGTRELRRLAKRLGQSEADARFGLALAHQAGLVSLSGVRAVPTTAYDQWLRREPAERLADLLLAWWRSPVAPLAIGGAINPGDDEHGTPVLRTALLAVAARSPGTAVADPAALAALTGWERPYAYGDPESVFDRALASWQEAALLGAVAAGAVSAVGRALLDGADLVAVLGDFGSVERTVRLQADLSAVVTGTPAPELAELLDAAADIETRGTATTWRFSPASVRRAFDAGHTAERLLAGLSEAAASGGVPQPLEYLINDVARRHGAIRASAVACCLRGDDIALLAEIAADRRLRGLGLRQLAPTVLAAGKPLAETLDALRTAGYAPVAETDDGASVIERAAPHRVSSPSPARRPGRPTKQPRTLDQTPESLARALLAAPGTVAASPSRSHRHL